MVFGAGLRFGSFAPDDRIFNRTLRDSLSDTTDTPRPTTMPLPPDRDQRGSSDSTQNRDKPVSVDSARPTPSGLLRRTEALSPENDWATDSMLLRPDSLPVRPEDRATQQDTTQQDSVRTSTFLDDIISGQNKDSLVYRPKDKLVYIYNGGDVTYGTMNMKADFMRMELDTKQIYATGVSDTLGNKTRPEFIDGGATYTMDTILYNMSSGKAKIKGVATQEGEGFLLGDDVKKMPDNSINIKKGQYTTCDEIEHPHFYLQLTKAKVIPQKKVIVGPAYIVMEDVPLPIGIPEGFFPLNQERSSGIIIPSYGEETTRGFFLREGGYYWAVNDNMDLTFTGSIYTYGSWEAAIESNYIQRYKYNGRMSARYAKTIIGEPGDPNYQNSPSIQVKWSHRQDPKFNPGTTFSAEVNFATSGYRQYAATDIQDYQNTRTESTISYGKNWAGTPFSLSVTMRGSVNSQDSTISLSLPTANFNMSKIYPLRRKNALGKQRWYEKISMSYTGSLINNVTAKEDEIFSPKIFDKLQSGVSHKIPISTSFNLLNYINVSPSFNYNENWVFRKVERSYDPDYTDPKTGKHERRDTTNGFYRLWNYNLSLNATTKIYGTYDFTKHPKFPLRMLRHTLTPNIGFSYTPDFGNPIYGYYAPYQPNNDGKVEYYSPFEGGAYGPPGRGPQAALTFSLGQTLEAKVASKTDTSGMKKVKIIDNFSFSGNYNFLSDSLNLSPIALNLRMTIPGLKNFNINITATLDPYEVMVSPDGNTATRINKFMVANGKGLGRITNASWSTNYTFNSAPASASAQPAINDGSSLNTYGNPYFFDPDNPIDPILRRQLMSTTYYNFDIPWNLGLQYSINYTDNGARKNIIQTLSYNASVTLTPKWSITVSGGYDFEAKKITTGVFTLTRDLHCWQMSFSWVPTGARKSWQFNIGVKAGSLQDLKYEKSSSYLDNIDW